jgi:uncharacterized protein (DUF58 family)
MSRGIASFLSPDELQRLGRLALQSRSIVEGNLAGRHRSPLKGASSEFADHRSYFPGDDPRHIDWKVFGRTERYFVRRYEEETNLRVYLVIDRSASMGYGSGAAGSKYVFACRLAAAIGYVVLRSKDSVGLYLYSDKVTASMGARNSYRHLDNLLSVLSEQKPGKATATAATLHRVAETVRKRALIVIFSDLFDEGDALRQALAHFRKQRHDVILFHVLDPAEIDFPFTQGAEFEDLESGERLPIDPRRLAPDYRRAFSAFLDDCRKPCTELNIDYRLARTDQSPELFARAYLEERKRLSK